MKPVVSSLHAICNPDSATGNQAAHPIGRIPLPKTDLVPCFRSGSDRSGKPDYLKERSELRALKDIGEGFFVDHGRHFQLAAPVVQERGISSHTNVVAFSRVQNRLQKPTVNNYPIPAMGDHRLRWLYSFMISETAKADSY